MAAKQPLAVRPLAEAIARPLIVDNDNANPDIVVECAGEPSLPLYLCEVLQGSGFQVVAYHVRVQDGLTHLRLTVAESDGGCIAGNRRRQVRALLDAFDAK